MRKSYNCKIRDIWTEACNMRSDDDYLKYLVTRPVCQSVTFLTRHSVGFVGNAEQLYFYCPTFLYECLILYTFMVIKCITITLECFALIIY